MGWEDEQVDVIVRTSVVGAPRTQLGLSGRQDVTIAVVVIVITVVVKAGIVVVIVEPMGALVLTYTVNRMVSCMA